MPGALTRQLECLKPGDHVCPIHGTAAEQMAVAIAFVQEGLKRGERILHITADKTTKRVVDALTAAGVEVERESARGALRLLTKHEAYLRSDTFEPRKMIDYIREAESEAFKDGFSGLRCIGEMDWILESKGGSDQLIEYEALLNQYVADSRSTVLCQYQRSHFDSDTIHDIVRTHPIVLLDDLVCSNPYYEPPELLLKRGQMEKADFERQRLDWWIARRKEVSAREWQQKEADERLQEYEKVVESLDEMILVIDRDYRYILANRTYLQYRGLKEEQVVGRSVQDLLGKGVFETQVKEKLDACFLGKTVQFEMHFNYAEMGERDLFVSYFPVGGPACVSRVVCVLKDITESKRTTESLRENAHRLRSILDSMFAFVGLLSTEGITLEINRAPLAIAGITREEVIGKPFAAAYWWCHSAKIRKQINHMIRKAAQGETRRADVSACAAEGRRIVIDATFGPLRDAAGLITGVVASGIDVTARNEAETAAHESEQRFRQVVENMREVFWMTDADGQQMLYVSPAYETIWGASCESLYASPQDWVSAIVPQDQERVIHAFAKLVATGEYDEEFSITRTDGSVRRIHARGFPVRNARGTVYRLTGVAEDITKQKQLSVQLHQSQKMDAIGQLAGGIAHDFNNLLTVINGYSELAIGALPPDAPAQNFLHLIKEAGEQSAALTSQLLAFSRSQILVPRVLDLNAVVHKMEKMLRRLIGEDVQLATALRPHLGRVRADQGQMEQILLNLAVNGRDAMPQGGKLTIETNHVDLDEQYARTHVGARPGPYVMLAVTDSGTGMTEEVKQHIFEPFFTTKGQGKGTGLGLAVVHGIVKQSEGGIEVYSELGRGTSFKIYLPQVEAPLSIRETPPVPAPLPRGTETILLAEDEPAVRGLARHILEGCGYTVLEAANAKEALRIGSEYQKPIHLLLTDVVMPEMGGRALSEQLLPLHPGMKVLFTSGYTDDAIVRHGILHEVVNFLQKPFMPASLAKKVRELLD